MNPTLMLGFARQRLTSVVRLVLLAFLFGMPLLMVLAAPMLGLQAFRDISGLIIVFVAGAIGQDVSSGVLHLLLARPVTRAEYVTSRWLAAGTLSAVAAVLQLALGCGILMMRGAPPDTTTAALLAGEHVLRSFGISAVLVLCSSFMGGVGDLGVYFITLFSSFVAGQLGAMLNAQWVVRVAAEIQNFLGPTIELSKLPGGEPVSVFAIVSYVSTITLCIALAIMVMNRKELSYASG